MQDPITITRINRKGLEKILDGYSLEQLNEVPEGFNNNLFWNIAHVIVTQQLLMYKLSGLPMMIDDEMVVLYRKGTKTEKNATAEEVANVKELLLTTIDQTEEDLKKGVFINYKAYETSPGFIIRSVEDAINFNNFHEGIHLGYILALRKSLNMS
ncbi:DinB family protein [Aquimarina pacifica]|uniref:DinB family protein n=1 Tax=Aquimarina pacifica TaxID=1296415 RepID=UPI00046EA296|nr:DinB family protein [Aquimarina pacifica]